MSRARNLRKNAIINGKSYTMSTNAESVGLEAVAALSSSEGTAAFEPTKIQAVASGTITKDNLVYLTGDTDSATGLPLAAQRSFLNQGPAIGIPDNIYMLEDDSSGPTIADGETFDIVTHGPVVSHTGILLLTLGESVYQSFAASTLTTTSFYDIAYSMTAELPVGVVVGPGYENNNAEIWLSGVNFEEGTRRQHIVRDLLVETTPSSWVGNSKVNPVSSNSAKTINLPDPSTLDAGFTFTFYDSVGTGAATNNITLVPASGTINGAANYVINTNQGSATFIVTPTDYVLLGSK